MRPFVQRAHPPRSKTRDPPASERVTLKTTPILRSVLRSPLCDDFIKRFSAIAQAPANSCYSSNAAVIREIGKEPEFGGRGLDQRS